VAWPAHERDSAAKVTIVPDVIAARSIGFVGRRLVALAVVTSLALAACSGSDGTDVDDEQQPTIGGINGPAVVDQSFDPFSTDPSSSSPTDGG
jgi:hypothetical protein